MTWLSFLVLLTPQGHNSPCYFLQDLQPDHAWMDKEVREFARILSMAHEIWIRLPAEIKDFKSSYWPGAHLKRLASEQEQFEEVMSKKLKISKDAMRSRRAPCLSLTEWIKLMLWKERSARRRPKFVQLRPLHNQIHCLVLWILMSFKSLAVDIENLFLWSPAVISVWVAEAKNVSWCGQFRFHDVVYYRRLFPGALLSRAT